MIGDTALTLLEQIYDAALDPTGLPKVLVGVSEAVGGVQECFFAQAPDRVSFVMSAPRRDPAFVSSFHQHWSSATGTGWGLVEEKLATAPFGQVLDLRQLVDGEAFSGTEFYNDWWRAQQLSQATLIFKFATSNGTWGIYGVHLRGGEDDFGSDATAFFASMSPHLARAVSVRFELSRLVLQRELASSKTDAGTGIALVDAAGRLTFADPQAETSLGSDEGVCVEGGVLRLRHPEAAAVFGRLVRSCVGHRAAAARGGSFEIARPGGRSGLRIDVSPFRAELATGELEWLAYPRPVAIITIADPERRRRRQKQALQREFGLTPAEAEFALEIVRGDGRKAAAARMGISVSTARTHLSRVFEKTGVRRQAELVRLLLRQAGSS